MRKNELARQIGVTAAAVSQYELGQARPSAAVLARVALALSMPVDFFAAGFPTSATPGRAHFRSLRTTSQAERDQAEAFGEVACRVVEVVERHLRLPRLRLPHLDLAEPAGPGDVRTEDEDGEQQDHEEPASSASVQLRRGRSLAPPACASAWPWWR